MLVHILGRFVGRVTQLYLKTRFEIADTAEINLESRLNDLRVEGAGWMLSIGWIHGHTFDWYAWE